MFQINNSATNHPISFSKLNSRKFFLSKKKVVPINCHVKRSYLGQFVVNSLDNDRNGEATFMSVKAF